MAKLENKYSRIYDNIIDRAIKRNLKSRIEAKKILGYVEKHHIIPKCIGGSDDDNNLVYLTAKEHFVCHRLLTKMFNDVKISRKIRFAMNQMSRKSSTQQRVRITSIVYEKIRRDFANDISLLYKGKTRGPLSEEHKKSISVSSKGHKKTKETIEKMKGPKSEHQLRGLKKYSDNKKGTTLSEEEKQKLRKPKREGTSELLSSLRKGTVTVFDLYLKKSIRITKTEFDSLKNIRYVGLNSKLRVKHSE